MACRAEGPITTDDDERVESMLLQSREDCLDTAFVLVWVIARGAKDGATALQKPLGFGGGEGRAISLDNPAPAMMEPDDLIAAGLTDPYDGTDGRVQPWAVASTRQ